MRNFGVHLNALRAFEAAARLASFSRAAEELCVTHSTVSHHISGLEENVGVALFERRNRQVVLTPAGEALYPVLKTSFDKIQRALERTRAQTEKKTISVTVTPSFTNKWLISRLRSFQAEHPDISVQINSSLAIADLDREGLDIGIRTGLGNWKGLNSDLLMPINMSPLCSPDLLEGDGKSPTIDELLKYPLLHADVSPETGIYSEWREWLAAVGHSAADCENGLSFRDPGLALQAAVNGLGVAMGYVELAQDDLAAGRLIQPIRDTVRHPWSYYIVTSKNRICNAQTSRFCEWLRSQVQH